MTYAPPTLKALQVYLKDRTDLPWVSLGIVGDSNHRGGYHQGDDKVDADDYSVDESPRDEQGLTDAASGIDVGNFNKGGKNLRDFSVWLVEQCKADAPDTRDIREVIYSPDGKTVKRWDRLGKRSSGDDSHLSHTHISYHRDSEGRDKTALFRRYFEGEDDVNLNDKLPVTDFTEDRWGVKTLTVSTALAHGYTYSRSASDTSAAILAEMKAARLREEAILAAVKGLDAAKVIAAVNARAAEDAQRDAAGAQRDAGILALVQQVGSGQLAAEDVVAQIGRLLTRSNE